RDGKGARAPSRRHRRATDDKGRPRVRRRKPLSPTRGRGILPPVGPRRSGKGSGPGSRCRPDRPPPAFHGDRPMKRLLVPLDGSEFAEQALGPALGLASRHGATVHLAAVVSDLPPIPLASGDTDVVTRWFDDERKRAE